MLCGNFVRFSCLLIAFVVPSFSFIHDVPGIWPAVLSPNVWDVAGQAHFLKKRPSDFVHPGIWHTHEDLERIRRNVRAGKEPWASAYAEFKEDQFSLSNYTMQGPYPVLERGLISNYSSFTSDVRAAWQNALMWYITKDDAHYKVSTGILDAWGSNLTNIIGTDRSLMIGLEGDLFVNAAEIMRWEAGWREAGAAWQGGSGFSLQLYFLFSRQSAVVGQANYGMISIKSMLSFAVYLDDVALYNYAMSLYINDPCAGVPATYEPKTGQSSESGRDQGHAQSGIGWAALGARVAQSQGSDLYGLHNNLLLKGAEYTAKFNLNHSVPYDPSWYRCEAVLVDGPWKNISDNSFGVRNGIPIWDHLYYQYHVKRGLPAPYVTEAKQFEGFEGHITNDDLPGWGSLVFAY